ncbi:glycoside hydrolase family 97 protein [Bremerella cremea]|uniref:Glycoside hydrolase n=1 Tax=Blastopirellula marina TaxID=124 RepID=A0A2S8FQJ1_9BACT|nr:MULTISPECIES: glycoside hydrolase family 97 protein [Pirellulaceae]PQO34432.1 glycoside hydrolase [Blastopirellula marina]RCS46928.1 glycoside hydrolase family 97 protein [Bremerella cremea]
MITARHCILLVALLLLPNISSAEDTVGPQLIESPDGHLQFVFQLDEKGQPTFVVKRDRQNLVDGTLGLKFADAPPLQSGLQYKQVTRDSRDITYTIPVGKTSLAHDRHNQLTISLQETAKPERRLDLQLRAFDDGIAFRYVIPQQPNLKKFVLTDELTTLTFAEDTPAHYLPLNSFTTPYEKYYQSQPLAEISPESLIGLPMLMEPAQEETPIWLAVTEADLTNYAGMYLTPVNEKPGTFATALSPLPGRTDGAKVMGEAPFASPWRVLMIAEDPGRLIESDLVFHLNEPAKIKDPSWIKPGKSTFPWWNHFVLGDVDFKPGVNTATTKHYIDFCAQQGIPYHSLDGLDIAWYGGPIAPNGPTDVTTAADPIDLPEVLRYAKEKGVRLRLWVHWKALKPQLDEALATYEKWGIEGIMIDFMDRDDQEMVQWYHEVAEKAARHHLTVTWHGAYKPTGMERTWPNVLSYEGVLNQEYNKWSEIGTPPKHNLDAAFIRMLAGPLDYHQGGMRNELPSEFKPRDVAPPVQGTRGHQLAMYVVYQNHLSMLVDYPNAYRDQPGLDFLVDVPANWDETRVLHADFGKCLIIARRLGTEWYVGGMTADQPCQLDLSMSFLGNSPGKATWYFDDESGDPTSLEKREQMVAPDQVVPITMPASGGFVGRISTLIPN